MGPHVDISGSMRSHGRGPRSGQGPPPGPAADGLPTGLCAWPSPGTCGAEPPDPFAGFPIGCSKGPFRHLDGTYQDNCCSDRLAQSHPPVSPASTTQPPSSVVVKAEPVDACIGTQLFAGSTLDVLHPHSAATQSIPGCSSEQHDMPDPDELVVTRVVIKRPRLRGKTSAMPNSQPNPVSAMVFA